MRNITATFLSGISLLFGGCATVDLTEMMGQKAGGQDSVIEDPASQDNEEESAEEVAQRDYGHASRQYWTCVFLKHGIHSPLCVKPEKPVILQQTPNEETQPAPTPAPQSIVQDPQNLDFQPAS